MKILIKNGRVVDPGNKLDDVKDILIENGKIKEVAENINISCEKVIDAKGKYVFPGLVDMHCHLREPGFEYKETIKTGTHSAAFGGFTSIACMPNTNPVIDSPSVVNYIKDKASAEGFVNVFVIGSISKGLKGEKMSDIAALKTAGCVAVSDDGRPVVNSKLMRDALQTANGLDIAVISHCEDLDLAGDGVMNEGVTSAMLGLKGISRASEEVMVVRECIIAESLGVPVHIAHVSTEGAVDLIRHYKRRGAKITAETCPHYFSITDSLCTGYNTLAKVNPPIRTDRDVEAVKNGLKDGTIDVIATDHAPHHFDEKNTEFSKAANGMVGFETALALGITNLVKTGVLTIDKLIEKMTVNPSKILKINKGTLNPGADADLTIVDLNSSYIVEIDKLHSKSKNSPYGGMSLDGVVECTIVGGRVVVEKVM